MTLKVRSMRQAHEHSHGLRIGLVEDDEQVRRSLQMLLRARGFAVDAYRSAVELLSNRDNLNVDCLVIDYKMPRINGIDLIRKLRAAGDATPAVMITGFFSNTLHSRAVEAGYLDVIEKSSEPKKLLERLRLATERPTGS